ncbi:MAG: alpha/beta hydrolase, partial [Sphingomonadales bacterium]|nr:alpha/beta hydrolase [Sphingomonadales bacterium]
LVVSHGAQGAWSHWIRNIDRLSAERMLIAVDMPGHGDSAMPATEDHRGISAALAAGLREILGGRQADLAGFSFGGCAFGHFAAWYPELVRRLVLIGTGGLDTPHGHVRLGRVAGLKGEERKAMLRSNLLGLMLHHPDSVDELAEHLLVVNARRARLATAADLVLPDKLARILPEVSVQVDAIWGEFDRPHPDPALQEAVFRRTHPDCDFRVIADAGHWAMYERPEAFDAALLDILRQPLRQRA